MLFNFFAVMTRVTISEAAINLASLIERMRGGETVLITDGTTALAELSLPKSIGDSDNVQTQQTQTQTQTQAPEDHIQRTYRISAEEFYRRYPEYTPAKPPTSERVFGNLEGQVWMADDFDDPLEDFKEYM